MPSRGKSARHPLHEDLREARAEGEKLLHLVAKLGAWSLLDDWLEGRITTREFRERLRKAAEKRGVKIEIPI